MSRLEGKVAIVTGGGAGQGAEEVRVLAALGAKVVATDLDADAVQAVAASVNRESPGRALALPHDVASAEDWSRVVAEAARAFGPVSILVNNAGILNRVAYE